MHIYFSNAIFLVTIKKIVKMGKINCTVCGKEKIGEFLQSSLDESVVVCSEECAKEHEARLPHRGRPVQHYSRITGYYQNVAGWNDGKMAELRDRKRYGVEA